MHAAMHTVLMRPNRISLKDKPLSENCPKTEQLPIFFLKIIGL